MPHVSAAARRRERARRHILDYGVQTACAAPGRGHRKAAKRARDLDGFYEGPPGPALPAVRHHVRWG